MNVNFEAIEKTWFKPKNKILFTKEELELLEDVFGLAIDECPSEDIKKINELEQKIKTYSGVWFKPKKTVLDELEEYTKSEYESLNKKGVGYFARHGVENYIVGRYETLEDILDKIQEIKKGE